MPNTPKATEYKIEILDKNYNKKNDDSKEKESNNNFNKWETAMIVDNGENECMLRGLIPSNSYLIRVCRWNINGWSCYIRNYYMINVHKNYYYLMTFGVHSDHVPTKQIALEIKK